MGEKPNIWHREEERFLRNVEEQANLMYDHYRKEYGYYHGLAQKFNIPIIAISALNALTAVVLNEFVPQSYVSIINAVLSAGTGVLGSVQLYLKVTEKTANALKASQTMKKLAVKISKELTIDPEHRVTEGKTFLNDCHAEFITCIEQGNPVEKRLPNLLALVKDTGGSTKGIIFSSPKARILSIAEKLRLVGSSSGESSPKEDPRHSEVIV